METDYRLTIDKLEITYTAPQETRAFLSNIDTFTDTEQTFILQRVVNKKGTYKHYFIVLYSTGYDEVTGWDYGVLGTLYFGSYNANRQQFYFQFENKALYTDGFAYGCLDYITSYIGLDFYQVSKLDLAFDCNRDINKQIYRICRNECVTIYGTTYQYDVVINGKKVRLKDDSPIKWICNGTREQPLKNKPPVIHNGKKTISLKAYDKVKEIRQASGKDYILDGWKSRNMYRVEISFTNASEINKVLTSVCHTTNKALYTELLLSNLNNSKFLYGVYNQALESLLYVTSSAHRRKEKLNIVFFALNSLKIKAKLSKKGRIRSIC